MIRSNLREEKKGSAIRLKGFFTDSDWGEWAEPSRHPSSQRVVLWIYAPEKVGLEIGWLHQSHFLRKCFVFLYSLDFQFTRISNCWYPPGDLPSVFPLGRLHWFLDPSEQRHQTWLVDQTWAPWRPCTPLILCAVLIVFLTKQCFIIIIRMCYIKQVTASFPSAVSALVCSCCMILSVSK